MANEPAVQGGLVTSTGIRELKDNLSRYIRRIEAGERMSFAVIWWASQTRFSLAGVRRGP